jgi:PEGA domain
MKYSSKFASLILLCTFALQGAAQTVPTTTPTPTNEPPKPSFAFGLYDGTPIKLRINRTVSSADAKTGETVDFEVLEDVKVGEIIVIPRGGIALATVTEAKPRRNMGRAGRLNVNIDSVRLVNGEKVALRAIKEVKGGSHTAAMTGAIVATSILFFPAAPLFLFMKGKDITIPKGTEITAYINGNIPLDQAKLYPPIQTADAPTGQTAVVIDPESSAVSIKSNPDGAEIMIDGKFVGNTPSNMPVKAGDHLISIKKSGYLLWEKTIALTAGGNISLEATLDKSP